MKVLCTNRATDRWANGQAERRIYTNRHIERHMNKFLQMNIFIESMDIRISSWTDGQTDRRFSRNTYGEKDARIDGYID
jgi:hypothetical protein